MIIWIICIITLSLRWFLITFSSFLKYYACSWSSSEPLLTLFLLLFIVLSSLNYISLSLIIPVDVMYEVSIYLRDLSCFLWGDLSLSISNSYLDSSSYLNGDCLSLYLLPSLYLRILLLSESAVLYSYSSSNIDYSLFPMSPPTSGKY